MKKIQLIFAMVMTIGDKEFAFNFKELKKVERKAIKEKVSLIQKNAENNKNFDLNEAYEEISKEKFELQVLTEDKKVKDELRNVLDEYGYFSVFMHNALESINKNVEEDVKK